MAITRGHKTLGVWWLFELLFMHQSLLYLDSEVASKSRTAHTAIRWRCVRWIHARLSYVLRTDNRTQIVNLPIRNILRMANRKKIQLLANLRQFNLQK